MAKNQESNFSETSIIKGNQPRVLGYWNNKTSKKKKRALLSYLSQPVIDELSGHKSIRFSNDGIATAWPKVLNKLGYEVDIINWDDCSFKFTKKYDVIIGHGGINFSMIQSQMNNDPFIYFSTGSYWKYHNNKEKERFLDFKIRHNVILPMDRYIHKPEESALNNARAIVCLGNEELKNTYRDFNNVYTLPIGSFTSHSLKKSTVNIEMGRKNILFIAGAGNIHKGLDLVIEAISDLPEFTLHIYTFLDSKFTDFYDRILKSKNIIIHNFEPFPCQQFLDTTKICNVAIMPSCSEGSPGSIVESMIQGLVPIVSKEAHLDVDGFGTILQDNTVETIKRTILEISNESTKNLVKRSHLARKIGLQRHSRKKFEKNLLAIMKKIEKDNL